MNKLNNSEGITLVEVVVTVALISILSLIFFDLIIGNFIAIKDNMDVSQEYRADTSKIFENYDNLEVGLSETTNFFGKNVQIRTIEGDETSVKINISDYTIQEKPFLDTNGNLKYDSFETELEAVDLINTPYLNATDDILVILNDKIFEGVTIDTIDWDVKGGIYIDSNLEIEATQYINIKTNNQLIFKSSISTPIYLKAITGINLEGLNGLNLMQIFIESSDEVILQGASVYLEGTDQLLTSIEYNSFLEINGIKRTEVSSLSDIDGVSTNSKTIIKGGD